MNIPVKQSGYEQPITVQELTPEGDLWDCNHAGAEIESRTTFYISANDGEMDDYESEVLACDKCNAWYSDEDQEWRNE